MPFNIANKELVLEGQNLKDRVTENALPSFSLRQLLCQKNKTFKTFLLKAFSYSVGNKRLGNAEAYNMCERMDIGSEVCERKKYVMQ